MPDTRINLHVYATEDGKPVYHVLHIGFFPKAAAHGIVDRLAARSLAFHSSIPDQTGAVDIVTCLMGPKSNPEIVVRREVYTPRRAALAA